MGCCIHYIKGEFALRGGSLSRGPYGAAFGDRFLSLIEQTVTVYQKLRVRAMNV